MLNASPPGFNTSAPNRQNNQLLGAPPAQASGSQNIGAGGLPFGYGTPGSSSFSVPSSMINPQSPVTISQSLGKSNISQIIKALMGAGPS